MRYLKSHQVPFLGFSWDHPLRARWREMREYDPIASLKVGRCGIGSPRQIILQVLGLLLIVGTFWALSFPPIIAKIAEAHRQIVVLPGLMLLVGVTILGILVGVRAQMRIDTQEFTIKLNELGQALGIPFQHLPVYHEEGLREAAFRALRKRADKVKALQGLAQLSGLGIEAFDLAIETRQKAREQLKEAYQLFAHWGFVPKEPKSEVDKVYAAIYAG